LRATALLAAAVLGNLKIEIFNERNPDHGDARQLAHGTGPEWEVSGYVGVEGGMVVAGLIPVMGALTVANLLGNQLDAESAKMLAEVAKQKGISLCGIQRDQTTAYFRYQDLQPPDAILLVSDLSQAVVTGALTVTNLLRNRLDAESAKMLAEVAKQKGISLCGIQRDQTTAYFRYQDLKPPDAILLVSDLSQAVVTGALTVTNLLRNRLDAESAKMLAEVAKQKGISLCGIQRDQTTADFRYQDLKPPDAILLVSDLTQAVVTGALTVTNLLHNQLDEASAKMLAEVAKQKGISLCGIQRDRTTADFSNKFLMPPDAILLASDLSQAAVTGACDSYHSRQSVCSAWTDAIVLEVERRELGLLVTLDGLADCAYALILEVIGRQIKGRQPAADENRVSLSPQIQT
jgi:uncharacterized protein YjbI with pentapeptide repeats